MIDYLNVYSPSADFELLKEKPDLNFTKRSFVKDGKEHYEIVLKSGNVKFEYEAGNGVLRYVMQEILGNNKKYSYFTVKGSIHKNHFGGQNYEDFYYSNVCEQIKRIVDTCGIAASDLKLKNVEFGVNIETDIPAFDLIRDRLIAYQGEAFNQYDSDSGGKSIGYYRQNSAYAIKIYDKAKHYGEKRVGRHLLRVELKFRNLKTLKKLGFVNAEDLMDKDKLRGLKKLLLASFQKVMWREDIIVDNIPSADRTFLENADNPKLWRKFKTRSSAHYSYQRAKFLRLKKLYCSNMQDQIAQKINAKFDELLNG